MNIKNGKEFLEEFNKEKGNTDRLYYDGYMIQFAKSFAKYHVENALNEVSLQNEEILDKNIIINAYPLNLIK